jgi:hypothetical protein
VYVVSQGDPFLLTTKQRPLNGNLFVFLTLYYVFYKAKIAQTAHTHHTVGPRPLKCVAKTTHPEPNRGMWLIQFKGREEKQML